MTDPLIYRQLAEERHIHVPEQHRPDEKPALAMMPPLSPIRYDEHVDFAWPLKADPLAGTAGQQDHTDPWSWAGPDADPPEAA